MSILKDDAQSHPSDEATEDGESTAYADDVDSQAEDAASFDDEETMQAEEGVAQVDEQDELQDQSVVEAPTEAKPEIAPHATHEHADEINDYMSQLLAKYGGKPDDAPASQSRRASCRIQIAELAIQSGSDYDAAKARSGDSGGADQVRAAPIGLAGKTDRFGRDAPIGQFQCPQRHRHASSPAKCCSFC